MVARICLILPGNILKLDVTMKVKLSSLSDTAIGSFVTSPSAHVAIGYEITLMLGLRRDTKMVMCNTLQLILLEENFSLYTSSSFIKRDMTLQ